MNFVLSDGNHYTKPATDEIEHMLSDKCKSVRYVRVHFNNKFKLVKGIAYLDEKSKTIFKIGSTLGSRFREITVKNDEQVVGVRVKPF